MRTAVLLAFALTLSAVAAPVPKGLLPKRTDAELIEGRWECVSMDDGRGPTPHNGIDLIRDGVLYFPGHIRNGEPGLTITLDPIRSPKHLDLKQTNGKVLPGIYQFDGDTLTYCFAKPGELRPTEFKGSGGTTYSVVMTRAKGKE